ncbi:hypothetical protein M9H77_27542 [Catharanthus roseus]|uniref:Uncharacterized protein n=1 Tax=Catharanthus roseus TaxID=4058 RepID=A0ACC0AD67_CATRO|nr:hypothetical protein M9H77_27542 [Catharanthus roseus]
MLRLQDLRMSSCNRLSSYESHVPPRNILRFLQEQTLVVQLEIYDVCAHKIYNVVAKIKRNRMQRRNTVEEVLCLSAQRGYNVFYRNRKESNVQHATIRSCGMTPTGKNFIVATAFMCNEQATTYRWVLQQIKYLYFISAMSNGQDSIINEGEPLGLDILSVVFWGRDSEPCYERAFCVETMAINMSRHLALKKIMNELKKAREMVEEPGSNCLHYLRKLHGLSCACELAHRCQYLIPREEDVDIFWRKLKIGYDIPKEHD